MFKKEYLIAIRDAREKKWDYLFLQRFVRKIEIYHRIKQLNSFRI